MNMGGTEEEVQKRRKEDSIQNLESTGKKGNHISLKPEEVEKRVQSKKIRTTLTDGKH